MAYIVGKIIVDFSSYPPAHRFRSILVVQSISDLYGLVNNKGILAAGYHHHVQDVFKFILQRTNNTDKPRGMITFSGHSSSVKSALRARTLLHGLHGHVLPERGGAPRWLDEGAWA